MDVFDIEVDQKYWDSIICDDLEENENILHFENCLISAKNLNIKNKFSGIAFKSCSFTGHQEIKNIDYGKAFIIENCSSSTPFFSRIDITDIHCNVFEHSFNYEQPYSEESDILLDSSRLFLNIKNSSFDRFKTNCRAIPAFEKVTFNKKLNIISSPDSDNEILFKKCLFKNFLEVNFEGFEQLSLRIENSKSFSEDDQLKHISFNFNNTNIKKLEVEKSNLGEVNLELFDINISNVNISESTIRKIDLHTRNNKTEEANIYNLLIINSAVKSLLLNNRVIIQPINFSNTNFLLPPSFLGTTISHGGSFPNIKNFSSRSGDSDAAAYRTLRYTMENHRNRDLEGMFFALEQESILNKNKSLLKYLTISFLYKIFSEYGTNTARPIVIFLISILIFSLSYTLIKSPKIDVSLPIDWSLIKESFTFSLQQSLSPFSYLRDAKLESDISLTLLALTILQSIISITCIALSALVIRWKFKRG